jgi:menaquinone reductase, molybdopterin-binding-like subunit
MTTRRAAVQIIAGSAVGVVLTPAPWRLIRDSALWSENWPGIPRPARGAVSVKTTHCTLCPAGCAVRARCVGEQPVALAGVNGGLCALGVTGHHLPYDPGRVKQGPVEEARAAAAHVGAAERIAVLDLRPGRTASKLYRKAMEAANGLYLAPAQAPVLVNLGAAKTVLSMGAPLLDGWMAPCEVFKARDRFRLVQVEAALSRTAALADEWLTEGDAATLARQLEPPVLVIDREMSPAVVALNRELGGWGKTIVARDGAAGGRIEAVEDRSIRLLYIDESNPGEYIPWPVIEPKLAKDATVIAFTSSREGYARHAKFVLPTAVYPEALDD